jgi:dienelactone hydrolase
LKRWAPYLTGALILTGLGCNQPPQRPEALDSVVTRDRSLIAGDPFQHLIVRQGVWDESSPVRVYLEGDGLPWLTPTRVAKDPTPRNPLALRLMSRDPGAALYLGRPCYHGLAASPECSTWLWTHGRYSEHVVRSMAAALRRALGPDPDREVTLVGYSGGGALAMLIASRIEKVRTLVTIAANLDIDAWADHHGYSRLSGSLNPATQPPLPARIRQIHLAGERDARVPAKLSRQALSRQPKAQLLVIPNFDHRCCWERAWPSILAGLEQRPFVLDATTPQQNPAAAESRL